MNDAGIVVLTGGGTAGHVTPNLALAPLLAERGFRVEYVGSWHGIERELAAQAGLAYHAVSVGKLRRYASWENLVDPFRVVAGIGQAWRVLGRLRARVVFSKGGFVGLPVVVAGRLRGIPCVVHESDLSPGLANRLCFPFARRICVSYEETLRALPERLRARALHTGSPMRASLFAGDRARGRGRFALSGARPTVLVFGGSLGAQALNRAVRELVEAGGTDLQFVHVCGAGHLDPKLEGRAGYRQFEFLHEEFADALACADVVVCRGGANSLAELVALRKPAIVVPLPATASRGDQLENARRHAKRGYGIVLPQEELTAPRLRSELDSTLADADSLRAAMQRDAPPDAARVITDLLEELASEAPLGSQ